MCNECPNEKTFEACFTQFVQTTKKVVELLIHSLVMSMYGVNKSQLFRLQLLQNMAARLVTRSPKSSHITPILKQLHWLPVEQRIVFKLSPGLQIITQDGAILHFRSNHSVCTFPQ